ncbi:MAG: amidohydrolase family protein [Gemmatimonadaceae bacterium]|nr:amidohydrolase family protein [Gemmatimonadaceae bacterium]
MRTTTQARARRTSLAVALALTATLAATAGAQETVAITGGTIYPVSGPRIENGTIVFTNGVITAIGANVAIPAGARRVDAAGKWITPGLVATATSLGVVEVGAVRDTRDQGARGTDNIAAAFRVWDAFNPAAVTIPVARQDGGITTVGVMPAGGLVAGLGAVYDLRSGSTADAMLRRAPAAMAVTLDASANAGTGSRAEALAKLRTLLRDAREFNLTRARYDAGAMRELSATRADLEAMQLVLKGTVPMVIAADRASEILNAIALGREFGVRVVIAGAAEAWSVAPQLAAAKVPVLTGAMNNIPESFSSLGQRQENLAMLRAAGVAVAILGNGPGGEDNFNVRNLRYEAGNAVAYGMSWDDALRAITLAPAEILGVADKVGSLAVGKAANVVVWSGDPFEYATQPEKVFVAGSDARVMTRQDLLTARYRTLPVRY